MPNVAEQHAAVDSSDPGATLQIYEGFHVGLQPAPVIKRILAYGTDLGVITVSMYVVFIVGGLFFAGGAFALSAITSAFTNAKEAFPIFAVLAMVLLLLIAVSFVDGYFIYFEYKKGGQTPGKRLFGLKVISLRSGNATLGQIVMRDLFRYLDCILIFPGLISLVVTGKKQRIGDLVASTMVVHSAEREKTDSFLYVGQADYHHLKELLDPTPAGQAECGRFLQFAFPYFLAKSLQPDETALTEKEAECRAHLGPRAGSLDRQTVLLFYAELCLQTLNATKR